LNDGKIGYDSDIWAFACLIFNLFTGVAPFAGENAAELMDAVSNMRFVPQISVIPRKAKALIDAILQIDPARRLGHGEALAGYPSIKSHPFFAGVDWEKLGEIQMPMFTKLEEEGPPSVADPFWEEGEKVVMEATVDRKRMLSWKPRLAVLTNKKRLLLFHCKKNSLKQEIKVAMGTRVEVAPNGKDWTLTWAKGMSQAFRSKDGQGGIWAATIMRESLKP
jgi:3-phosphoinositide dependent protein kinase-1